jgi:hypothetical protein
MTAKADVAIMFPWDPIPIQILREIDEKNRSFMKLFTTVIRETSAQQTTQIYSPDRISQRVPALRVSGSGYSSGLREGCPYRWSLPRS